MENGDGSWAAKTETLAKVQRGEVTFHDYRKNGRLVKVGC